MRSREKTKVGGKQTPQQAGAQASHTPPASTSVKRGNTPAASTGPAAPPPPPSAKAAAAAAAPKQHDEHEPCNDNMAISTMFGLSFTLSYKYCTIARNASLVLGILLAAFVAYTTRLLSIQLYGYLIHEFDPWFNFRATQYMSAHGWKAFFHWFDYASWYPLGRPVGSTTYPGLQITAVAIHRGLNAMGISMSLNDVCVLIPAWFGALATILLAALTYEVSGSLMSACVSSFAFCILPAHLMRSMAGEFDNECIALAAMLLTFYLWVRSLRCPRSWPIGVLAGLAYGYMVAAWGGYIFVINMVALHAGVCALNDWMSNTYNPSLLRAYALFYVIGTAIATRVPPVGMAPFKSLEQLSALMVLLFLFGLEMAERVRARTPDVAVRSRANMRIRFRVFSVMGGVLLFVAALLAPTGYFGPLSSRVRALFVAHTRTGNPLVDSVAEHRSASLATYWQYLLFTFPICVVGMFGIVFLYSPHYYALWFIMLLGVVSMYFCGRMVRLIILAGPPAACITGVVVGALLEWCWAQLFWPPAGAVAEAAARTREKQGGTTSAPQHGTSKTDKGRSSAASSAKPSATPWIECASLPPQDRHSRYLPSSIDTLLWVRIWPRTLRMSLALLITVALFFNPYLQDAPSMCFKIATQFANPRLIIAARTADGRPVKVDDYLQAYLWLKNNTPTDARVLAWWDYGYQITGIGERTTLADGNTWNHEHIATIGKMLTSPVTEAHSLVRHMADYVLIWANQGGDLGKSPHMARIGNSVYRDICPADPLCDHFGFYGSYEQPTPMMKASLLYNLHEHGKKGMNVDASLFREVHTTRHGLVRIYKVMNVSKESKQWVANPENRRCVSPGSWICPGQYPPAKEIQDMLAKRVDFSQLEDFNRKGQQDAYYHAYMARANQNH